MRRLKSTRLALLLALLILTVWAAASSVQRAKRDTLVLATTECPFVGEARVTISPDVTPADVEPVRAHESIHAEQCGDLGPWKYRWTNLRSGGRLSLEAPAYCAGAAARVRAGADSLRVRRRLIDDATEALRGLADSATVVNALRAACPELTGLRMQATGLTVPIR